LMPYADVGRHLVRRTLRYLPKGQALSDDVWRVRHRTLSYLLRAHIVVIFCFALIRGYSLMDALLYAGLIGVIAALGSTDPRRRKFVSAMIALGLVTCSAVLVSLSGGVTEMHFHFFVIVGILTLYQDWLPFLLAIGFVVVHHVVLGFIDPDRLVLSIGVWGNAAVLVLWGVTRTVGLPIGPETWRPEAVGAPDVVSCLCELAVISGAAWLLTHPTRVQRRRPALNLP
jgi:hypothetical protein